MAAQVEEMNGEVAGTAAAVTAREAAATVTGRGTIAIATASESVATAAAVGPVAETAVTNTIGETTAVVAAASEMLSMVASGRGGDLGVDLATLGQLKGKAQVLAATPSVQIVAREHIISGAGPSTAVQSEYRMDLG